jgi:hypothetical protein
MSHVKIVHNNLKANIHNTEKYVAALNICAEAGISPQLLSVKGMKNFVEIEMVKVNGVNLAELCKYYLHRGYDDFEKFITKLISALMPTIEKFFTDLLLIDLTIELKTFLVDAASARFFITEFKNVSKNPGAVDRHGIYDAFITLTNEIKSSDFLFNESLVIDETKEMIIEKVKLLTPAEISIHDYITSPVGDNTEYKIVASDEDVSEEDGIRANDALINSFYDSTNCEAN